MVYSFAPALSAFFVSVARYPFKALFKLYILYTQNIFFLSFCNALYRILPASGWNLC